MLTFTSVEAAVLASVPPLEYAQPGDIAATVATDGVILTAKQVNALLVRLRESKLSFYGLHRRRGGWRLSPRVEIESAIMAFWEFDEQQEPHDGIGRLDKLPGE